MKLHQGSVPRLLSIFLLSAAHLYGQDHSQSDSAFAVYMDSADAHLERTHYYDRLRYKYADEFYQYYLQHPDSEIGKEALKDTFVMWIDIGETDKVLSALEHIPYDSDAWYDILRLIGSSYAFQKSRHEEYMIHIKKLEQNTGDPKNRTAALFLGAQDYLVRGDQEALKKRYNEIVKVNADTFYTGLAHSYLQELEKHGLGRQASNFRAETVGGDRISLKEQKGKVVILYFWHTCCVGKMPNLMMLREKYEKEELQIIGISLDSDENDVRAFLDNYVLDWPQVIQPQGFKDKIPSLYNVRGQQTVILIDKDGIIEAVHIYGKRLNTKVAQLVDE